MDGRRFIGKRRGQEDLIPGTSDTRVDNDIFQFEEERKRGSQCPFQNDFMQRGVLLEQVSREINRESCLSGEIFPGLERRGDLSTQPEMCLFEIADRYVDDLIGVSFDLEMGEADVVRISGEKAREPIGPKGYMFLIVREFRAREADRKPIGLAEEDRFFTDSFIAPSGPEGIEWQRFDRAVVAKGYRMEHFPIFIRCDSPAEPDMERAFIQEVQTDARVI